MDFLAKATTFTRIVETGSLSAAGRSLRLSLAAISRQMAALETELGVTLLVRTTRSQQLTEEGRRFHEHAQRLVREAEAARASVQRGGPIAGDFVLSASATIGVLRIVPFLPGLQRKHPHLRLEIRLEDREVDLVRDGVDLAVRAGMALPDSSELVGLPLATYRRVIVGAPKLLRAAGTPRDAAALANRPVVTGLRSPSRWTVDGKEVPIDVQLRIGTLLGIREAAVAGMGLAMLPDFVVADAIASRALVVVLGKLTLPTVAASAVYRVESRSSPRIRAVASHLRATMPLG